MGSQDNPIGLGPELRDRVIERLGFSSAPPPDLGGLRALYAAWCAHVPFDNVRKMIALLSKGTVPLPGAHGDEFFENWLTHGAGGTCWPTSNALFELVQSFGFQACRIACCMGDPGIVNHASVRVEVEGSRWLVDSSMLTNVPLPLGRDVFVHGDPVFPVEVEPADGTHIIWFETPPNSEYLPCRLGPDPVDHAYYVAAYEGTRERSVFNRPLYARRNRPGELLVVRGNTRFSRTAEGLQVVDLSPGEVTRVLREDVGFSQALVEQWVRAGGIEASLDPQSGPKPPPVTRKPPSRRVP